MVWLSAALRKSWSSAVISLCLLSSSVVAKGVLNGLCLEGKALLSIVAGLTYAQLQENIAAKNVRLLRTMPNTPLMVGCGAVAFSLPHSFHAEELSFAKRLFSSIGMVEEVEERLISAVTGISGSGPAYTYMFIEALADAGVKHGIPKALSLSSPRRLCWARQRWCKRNSGILLNCGMR